MTLETINEQETVEEGLATLIESLPASKVARLLSLWKVGQGDYVQLRQHLFKSDSLDSLYKQALKFTKKRTAKRRRVS